MSNDDYRDKAVKAVLALITELIEGPDGTGHTVSMQVQHLASAYRTLSINSCKGD